MFRVSIIVCLVALTACGESGTPKWSIYEVTGSRPERVARVSAILAKDKTPPTAILDAHFIEEQIGDGFLGPSDYREFYFVEVAPRDVSQWTRLLKPLDETAEYDAPAQPRGWWATRDTFASLQFYKPNILTGRIYGWIGVSRQTGRIYISTFTM